MGRWNWYVIGNWNDATIASGTAESEAAATAEVVRVLRTYKQAKRGGGYDRYGPDCFTMSQADLMFATAQADMVQRFLTAAS